MSRNTAEQRLHLKEQVHKTLNFYGKPQTKIKSFIDHSVPIELKKYIENRTYLLKRFDEFINQQMGTIQQADRRKKERKRYSQRDITRNHQHRDENQDSNFKNDPDYKSFLQRLNSSDLRLLKDNNLEKVSFQQHKKALEMEKNSLQPDHFGKEVNSKFGGSNKIKPEERNYRITQSLKPRDNVREINSVSKNRGYPDPKNIGGTHYPLNRRNDQAQNRNKNQGYMDIHQNKSEVNRSSKDSQRSQNKIKTSISCKNNQIIDECFQKPVTSTNSSRNGYTNNFHPVNGLVNQNGLKFDKRIEIDLTKDQNSTNQNRSFIKSNKSPNRQNQTNQIGDKHARNTQQGGVIGTKNMHVDYNPNDTNHDTILENSEKFPIAHSPNQHLISTNPSDTRYNIQGLTKPPQNMNAQQTQLTQYTASTQITQERHTPHKVYRSIEEYNKERLEEAIQASSGGYVHNLHLEIHPRLPDQFAGIVNIGNSCYLNSIIQILFYSECFREKILKFRSNLGSLESLKKMLGQYSNMSEGQKLENKKHFFELHGVNLIFSLQNLFSKMIKGKKLYVNPVEIFERIVHEMNLTPYVIGPQNDTVEFLDTFFNCLDAGFRKISQVGKCFYMFYNLELVGNYNCYNNFGFNVFVNYPD